MSAAHAAFPSTQWSQLNELRDAGSGRRARLLEDLVHKYWKPAYDFVRSWRNVPPDQAEDLTQQFFTTLLGRGDLERLSPEKGSFRAFLRTALRNFLVSADRAVRARPQLRPLTDADELLDRHPRVTPDEAFDRAWTQTVLGDAVDRLREELRSEGRHEHVAVFEAYCLDEDCQLTYEELGRRHGLSEEEVRGRLRETRRRMRQVLRRVVRDYLRPGEEIEGELSFILAR
jgi:RNA polymerase sigma-70 factor (ECF subfamily)